MLTFLYSEISEILESSKRKFNLKYPEAFPRRHEALLPFPRRIDVHVRHATQMLHMMKDAPEDKDYTFQVLQEEKVSRGDVPVTLGTNLSLRGRPWGQTRP